MRNSLRDHGYLMIDHRNSPGVPEWMSRMAGYIAPAGKTTDMKTLCCAHCKVHVVPNPQRPNSDRATCHKCNHHYICDLCAFRMTQPDYIHDPYEKKVDLALSGKPALPQPLGSPRQLLLP